MDECRQRQQAALRSGQAWGMGGKVKVALKLGVAAMLRLPALAPLYAQFGASRQGMARHGDCDEAFFKFCPHLIYSHQQVILLSSALFG